MMSLVGRLFIAMRYFFLVGPTSCTHATEHHGPRQRQFDRQHIKALVQKPQKGARAPVVDMPGGIAKISEVLQAAKIENSPQRFPRDAHDEVGLCKRCEESERPIRIRQVLKNFATYDEFVCVGGYLQVIETFHCERNCHPGVVSARPCKFDDIFGNIAASHDEAALRQP